MSQTIIGLQRVKSYENFQKKISKKTPGYIRTINRALKQFDEYSIMTFGKSRDAIISDLLKLDEYSKEDQTLNWIQGYVDGHNSINYATLQGYLGHIKKYLKYWRIHIDLKDEIEMPPKILEERYAIPLEEIQNIIRNVKWKYQGYFLSEASCGARPSEVMSLRKKDYFWTGKRWGATIQARFTKKKISRTVFFSSECSPYIVKILKNLTDEDRVWSPNPNCPDEKVGQKANTAGKRFQEACSRIGYDEKYESTGFYKRNMYCFRAFFFTKALDSLSDSKDLAHAMIGHGAYLQSYQRRTVQQKEELYEQIEPALLVFDQSKNIAKIKKLEEQNEKILEQDERLARMEKFFMKENFDLDV
tara:strand:- start:970 stop:2049 length:1080 start_codon:yes stop_codon:yes gene_type:complete